MIYKYHYKYRLFCLASRTAHAILRLLITQLDKLRGEGKVKFQTANHKTVRAANLLW